MGQSYISITDIVLLRHATINMYISKLCKSIAYVAFSSLQYLTSQTEVDISLPCINMSHVTRVLTIVDTVYALTKQEL